MYGFEVGMHCSRSWGRGGRDFSRPGPCMPDVGARTAPNVHVIHPAEHVGDAPIAGAVPALHPLPTWRCCLHPACRRAGAGGPCPGPSSSMPVVLRRGSQPGPHSDCHQERAKLGSGASQTNSIAGAPAVKNVKRACSFTPEVTVLKHSCYGLSAALFMLFDALRFSACTDKDGEVRQSRTKLMAIDSEAGPCNLSCRARHRRLARSRHLMAVHKLPEGVLLAGRADGEDAPPRQPRMETRLLYPPAVQSTHCNTLEGPRHQFILETNRLCGFLL